MRLFVWEHAEWHRGRDACELLFTTLVASRGTRLVIETIWLDTVAMGAIDTVPRITRAGMTRGAVAMGDIGKDWSIY